MIKLILWPLPHREFSAFAYPLVYHFIFIHSLHTLVNTLHASINSVAYNQLKNSTCNFNSYWLVAHHFFLTKLQNSFPKMNQTWMITSLRGNNVMIFTCVALNWLLSDSDDIRGCRHYNEWAKNKQLYNNVCLTIESFAMCVCMSCWLRQSQDVYSAWSFPQPTWNPH